MSELIESESELDRFLKASDKAAVLFYASWCPFSRRFLPIYERQTECLKQSCRHLVVDDLDDLIEKYSIEVFPTVLLFKKGKVASRLDGESGVGLNEEQLSDFISSCKLSQKLKVN
jgi:thiol-disulfide isomerase/thioredoxin